MWPIKQSNCGYIAKEEYKIKIIIMKIIEYHSQQTLQDSVFIKMYFFIVAISLICRIFLRTYLYLHSITKLLQNIYFCFEFMTLKIFPLFWMCIKIPQIFDYFYLDFLIHNKTIY